MSSPYRKHEYRLDQGDLLAKVPFTLETADGHQIVQTTGVLTSHGCDCERIERTPRESAAWPLLRVHVAPIQPATAFPSDGTVGNIRAGRVPRYYALPREGQIPEYVVDFWYEQPIHPEKLLGLQRIASLTEEEWIKMMIQHFVGRVHKDPADIFRDSLPQDEE